MIKGVKKIEVTRDEDHTKEINPKQSVLALIQIEKYWTSNLTVCVNSVQQNIKWGIKEDKYFVDEVETQLREKPLQGSQPQDIHYSEDKARYKAVTLTYP
jgi:hypothetical protein